jgi:hypothetical protein
MQLPPLSSGIRFGLVVASNELKVPETDRLPRS